MTNQNHMDPPKVKQEPPSESSESPRHSIEIILDIKKEMNVSDLMSRSPGPAAPGLTASTDSNITLWQFLLELLQQEKNGDIIEWTRGAEGEFRLIDAEAVARKWGQRKAKPHMNYDKLSRALRYYYEKNIIKKVIGKKFVYRFVTDVNNSADYQHLKLCFVKEEKDMIQDASSFLPPVANHRADFSALSLMSTDSASTTAHSVSTPSPTDSVCSPSSSIASSATANLSTSPPPSTSSPVEETTMRHSRKRSSSPATSSSVTASSNTASTASGSSVPRTGQPPPLKKGTKPNPLNLTATSNFVVPPISPLLMLQHQNSPLFQSSLGQLYAIASASLASAGLYGPQMSPLLTSQSPFRSPLTTPNTLGLTGVAEPSASSRTPSSDGQVFQFPPVSAFQQNSLINSFTNLISPMAPFMMPSQSSTSFKFPSSTDSLKTPTVPIKMPSI